MIRRTDGMGSGCRAVSGGALLSCAVTAVHGSSPEPGNAGPPVIVLGLGVLFPLIGAGLLVGAWFSVSSQRRQMASRVATMGTVVGFEEQCTNPGSSNVYCPIVEFAGPAGITRFVSAFGSRPAGYSAGQSVKVLYEPAHPQAAEIDSAVSRWFAPVVTGGMGCLFLLLGLALFGVGLLLAAAR